MIRLLKHMSIPEGKKAVKSDLMIVYRLQKGENGKADKYVLYDVYSEESDYGGEAPAGTEEVEFVAVPLGSTRAEAVTLDGCYVNVKGSSADPHICGKSWLQVLSILGCDTEHCQAGGKFYVDDSYFPNYSGDVLEIEDFSCSGRMVGGHLVPLGCNQQPGENDTVYLATICNNHNTKQLRQFTYQGVTYTASQSGTGLGFFMYLDDVLGAELYGYMTRDTIEEAIRAEDDFERKAAEEGGSPERVPHAVPSGRTIRR